MDILSMQIANKVLKRMNTEFNGLYDIFIATDGQKLFTTTREHDTAQHSLHIYVNGYHAVEGSDYEHINTKDIEFKVGLRKGDIVLASTQVVGIPKFEISNPEYDDSAVKNELIRINQQITNILDALDEDQDGSILDTISDIKKQWQDADGDIMTLIELKATREELEALEQKTMTRINEVEATIVPAYDDTDIKARISAQETETTLHAERLAKLETPTEAKDLLINDTLTGRKHKIVLTSGILSTVPLGTALALSHTASQDAIIGEHVTFKLNILANADINQKVKLVVSISADASLEYNDKSVWKPFTTHVIDSLTNLVYNMRYIGRVVGNHEITIAILKFDNNVELGKISFTIDCKEPPESIISGSVALNGAKHTDVTISLTGGLEPQQAQLIENGSYALRVSESGEYQLEIMNSSTTHEVVGERIKSLSVQVGSNYADNNFTLQEIVVPEEPKTMTIEYSVNNPKVGDVLTIDDFSIVAKDIATNNLLQHTSVIKSMTNNSGIVSDLTELTNVAGEATVVVTVSSEGYNDKDVAITFTVEESEPPIEGGSK